jgi:hypothetical protein
MSKSVLFSPSQLNGGPFLSAVDSISATKGMGVYVTLQNQARKLRAPMNAGSTVIIELRPPVGANSSVVPRNSGSSPVQEWLNLGMNCGGAAVSWVGVAGTTAAAPETGGLAGIGAVVLYGGALAASAQCSISLVRVSDLYDGHKSLNAAMDGSTAFTWTMYSLDAIGLANTGNDFLKGGAVLGAAAELDLLNRVFDAAGVAASAVEPGGVIHDSVVWVISKG